MKSTVLIGLLTLPLLALACAPDPVSASDDDEVVEKKKKKCGDDCEDEDGDSKSSTKEGTTTPQQTPTASACVDLKACTGATAPTSYLPSDGLSVKLEAISKEEIRRELAADVAAGGTYARQLAAAIGAAKVGEPEAVTGLRHFLHANPKIESAVQRQMVTVGFGSLDVYRDRFPVANVAVGRKLMDAPLPDQSCKPAVRIRLAKITVNEEEDDIANDEIYCSISVQSGDTQELKITPKTGGLNEGESQSFTSEAVVWGQGAPRVPFGDLTIKYDCFEAESNDGYQALVRAAADAAKTHGDKVVSPENMGYVSKGADMIGTYLPKLLSLDGDDHLFVANQTITAPKLMELAKGTSWTVNKSGSHLWSDWDWTLTMEAWGCAPDGK